MTFKALAGFFALLFSATSIWSAPDLSTVDLRPLLRMNATSSTSGESFPPSPNVLTDQDILITYGGALTSSYVERPEGETFSLTLVRGVIRPLFRMSLFQILVENRIGFLESCQNRGTGIFEARYEVTWYGRNGRRNQFVVVHSAAETGLPACPPEADRIVSVITGNQFDVSSDPESEVLFSGQ
jgi:hypothetical protein